jgi:hypothetical protein
VRRGQSRGAAPTLIPSLWRPVWAASRRGPPAPAAICRRPTHTVQARVLLELDLGPCWFVRRSAPTRHGLSTRKVETVMHTHEVDERVAARVPVGLVAKCILGLLVASTTLGTAFGLVHPWPSGKIPAVGALQTAAPGVSFPGAKLLKITPFSCPESGGGADGGEQLQPNGSDGSTTGVPKATTKTCAHLKVQVKDGAGKGDVVTVEIPDVVYRAGLRIGESVKLGSAGSTAVSLHRSGTRRCATDTSFRQDMDGGTELLGPTEGTVSQSPTLPHA